MSPQTTKRKSFRTKRRFLDTQIRDCFSPRGLHISLNHLKDTTGFIWLSYLSYSQALSPRYLLVIFQAPAITWMGSVASDYLIYVTISAKYVANQKQSPMIVHWLKLVGWPYQLFIAFTLTFFLFNLYILESSGMYLNQSLNYSAVNSL